MNPKNTTNSPIMNSGGVINIIKDPVKISAIPNRTIIPLTIKHLLKQRVLRDNAENKMTYRPRITTIPPKNASPGTSIA
ncbi:hypothetical protein RI065_00415 [Mycoplasmatota bacterium zrk1]